MRRSCTADARARQNCPRVPRPIDRAGCSGIPEAISAHDCPGPAEAWDVSVSLVPFLPGAVRVDGGVERSGVPEATSAHARPRRRRRGTFRRPRGHFCPRTLGADRREGRFGIPDATSARADPRRSDAWAKTAASAVVPRWGHTEWDPFTAVSGPGRRRSSRATTVIGDPPVWALLGRPATRCAASRTPRETNGMATYRLPTATRRDPRPCTAMPPQTPRNRDPIWVGPPIATPGRSRPGSNTMIHCSSGHSKADLLRLW